MPASDHTTSVEYRELEAHPGYRVGSDGSVWSRWRRKSLGRAPGGKSLGHTVVLGDEWKRLRPSPDGDGYPAVHLRSPGVFKVHRLVLEAFHGPRPSGMLSRHLNGIRQDNRAENLRWGTPQENNDDKVRHGTHTITPKGEKHGSAKLTAADVLMIRGRAARGETIVAISKDYAVHENTIGRIVARKRWAHV